MYHIVEDLNFHQLRQLKKWLPIINLPVTLKQLYLYITNTEPNQSQKIKYALHFLNKTQISQNQHLTENQHHLQLPKQLLNAICQQIPTIFLQLSFNNPNLWEVLIHRPNIWKNAFHQDKQLRTYLKQLYGWYFKEKQLNNQKVLAMVDAVLKEQDHTVWIEVFNEMYKETKQIYCTPFQILSLISIIHKDVSFTKSKQLKQHIRICLLDHESPEANSIACQVLANIYPINNQDAAILRIFFDVYETLGSFGTHLIKDVWAAFYILCEANLSNQSIFQLQELISIIITRLSKHKNLNVVKFCVQSILGYQYPTILFRAKVVFSSFIPALNDGVHFQDCPFFMDSKVYISLKQFFGRYFNSNISENQRKEGIVCLIQSIQKSSLEVCAVGLLQIFQVIEGQTDLLDEKQLERTILLVSKLYQRVPLRKKIQVMRCWCILVYKNMSGSINRQFFYKVIIPLIPQDYFKVPNQESTLEILRKIINRLDGSSEYILSKESPLQLQFFRVAYILQINLLQINHLKQQVSSMLSSYYLNLYKTYYQREKLLHLLLLVIRYQTYKKHNILTNYSDQIVDLIITTINLNRQSPNDQFILSKCIGLIKWIQNDKSIQILFQWAYNQSHTIQLLIQILKLQKHQKLMDWAFIVFNYLQDNKYQINASERLRLKTISQYWMMGNQNWLQDNKNKLLQQISDIVECYDYQFYSEVLCFISRLFMKINCQEDNLQYFYKGLSAIIDNTLHNLSCSILPHHVQAITQCILNFQLIKNQLYVQNCAIPLVLRLLKIGRQYWLFERSAFYHFLYLIDKHQQLIVSNLNWARLVCELVINEQYRGYQSQVALHQWGIKLGINMQYYQDKINKNASYDGTFIRFVTLEWIGRLVKGELTEKVINFILKIGELLLNVCLIENKKERMFMTGTHKNKLKSWQCLLTIFPIIIIYHKNIDKLLQSLLIALDHNNLNSVKHCMEIGIAKIISHIPPTLNTYLYLNKKLSDLPSLNKSITHLVLSGFLLELKFQESLHHKLLSFCCSHIAYFRGISEYFCFNRLIDDNKNPIVKVMKEQSNNNPGAYRLTERVNNIIQNFYDKVKGWSLQKDLLLCSPNLNGEVCCDDLMEEFKKLANSVQERQVGVEDGFDSIRQLWKGQKVDQLVQDTFQKKIEAGNVKLSKEHSLRILAASVKSIATLGHFARVGEILGVQCIYVESVKTLELDQFRNVSCTAQKWIKFYEFNNSHGLISVINECLIEGYQIVSLSKKTNSIKWTSQMKLPSKTLLIVDQMDQLGQVGKGIEVMLGLYMSVHVEVGLLIWQHFKNGHQSY